MTTAGIGDFTEHTGFNVPLLDDLEEAFELLRLDDRHHALLAFGHQNFFCCEGGVAQQYLLEFDEHATVTVRGELARCTADAGSAEVLDALNEVSLEQFEAALDEYFFGEGVADLNGGALGGATF